MENTHYPTQLASEPLFKDLLWSKPEQKSLAGKILIIGGNSHAINAPSEAFSIAIKQGAGEVKAVMPDKTKKLLGKIPADIEVVESTPSGSFSLKSEQAIKGFMSWSDATLFAGDFGRNSETAVLLEKIAKDMPGIQVFTRDSVDYFNHSPETLINRDSTLLVLSIAQLQKYCINLKWATPVTFDMGLNQLCQVLKELTLKFPAAIVVQHYSNIITSYNGKIVVTKFIKEPKVWRLKTATSASVWWMQNKSQTLEAISTSITQLTW